MKKYRGIIFDLDGVICCTDQYHERAWREMAEEFGIYFDPAVSNRLRGVSREESLEIEYRRLSPKLMSCKASK